MQGGIWQGKFNKVKARYDKVKILKYQRKLDFLMFLWYNILVGTV